MLNRDKQLLGSLENHFGGKFTMDEDRVVHRDGQRLGVKWEAASELFNGDSEFLKSAENMIQEMAIIEVKKAIDHPATR